MISGIGLFDQTISAGATGAASPFGKLGQNTGGVAETSFLDMLNAAATRTVDTLNRAETVSVQGMQGGADTREVVDAVMSAEQSLQAAVAIRDKIVSAYLDISRMAI